MQKNIVLIGFMGAGKSLVAKALAKRLKRKVVSTDVLIEKRERKTIAKIFAEQGEPYFRGVEKKVISEIAPENNRIIDCGGGVVLDQENILNLKKNGILFYLKADPEVIWERIKSQQTRPLLKTDNPKVKIEELLEKREPFYRQADYIIDANDQSIEPVCREIISLIAKERIASR